MKALLYTSDPYEPAGVVAIYNTPEEGERLRKEFRAVDYNRNLEKVKNKTIYHWLPFDEAEKRVAFAADEAAAALVEIEIPVGVLGHYY